MKYVSWFSCGAASAVATKLALQTLGRDNVTVVYQDTGSEHEDNHRFLKDCEAWFGTDIQVHKSAKYDDTWDVFTRTKYLVGPTGTRCTGELKRKVAEEYLWSLPEQPTEIFGYTAEEEKRVARFKKQNSERKIKAILVEQGITKEDCLALLARVGIKIPTMYTLGFNNNNCIACPKGGQGYWRRTALHFPEEFARMAKLERELNVAILKDRRGYQTKKMFLDELDLDGKLNDESPMDCGIICQTTTQDIEDHENL